MSTVNDAIIERILVREGFEFTDRPLDRGGPTKFGITMVSLREFLNREPDIDELRNLTKSMAARIYRSLYVLKPNFHRIADERLREQIVDSGVLHGRHWTARRLQEVVGVAQIDGIIGPITLKALDFAGRTNGLGNRFMQRRVHRIGRIVQRDQTQIRWLVGWLERALSFLET